MVQELRQDNVETQFHIDNIEGVLVWMLDKLRTLPSTTNETLPDWIRSTSSYRKGLFSFDEPSNILILRAAYFMGESFVLDNEKLRWGVGNIDTAVKNMPVVTGFINSMEMSPLMVLENTYKRILVDGVSATAFSKLIKTWRGYI